MGIMELFRVLKPLRRRMFINRALDCILWGLCIGGAVGVIVATAALFVPVAFALNKVFLCIGISFFAALVAAVFMFPDYKAVAVQGDKLGLKERLVTALELKDDNSPIARIQRFDAVKAARSINFKKAYPFYVDRKKLFGALGLFMAIALIFFIPSDQREIARQKERIKKAIDEQVVQVKKEQEKLSQNRELTLKEREELNEQLKELLKELKKSKNEQDAVKAIARMQHKLDEIKQNSMDKDLTRLGEMLSRLEETKEIGNALKEGRYDEIREKMDALARKLENMDENEVNQLAEEIEKIARKINENPELAEALQQLAQAMQSGQFSQELANMSTAMSKLAGNAAMHKAMQSLGNALSQARASLASVNSDQLANPILVSNLKGSSQQGETDSSNTGVKGQGSAGIAQGVGQGNSGSDSQGDSGEGEGNGGNGSGTGGSGVGDGTGSGREGSSQGGLAQGNSGKEPGEKKVRNYEEIYASKRIDGADQESYVSGTQRDSGTVEQVQVEDGPVLMGESLPYNEVFEQYRYEAMKSLERSTIPAAMKTLVEEYFSSLE
ncbi:MAG: hypothetical protein GX066_06125 [Clostridiaceae bacterium]|nr:hypothetical protein [Clostridiaceae bacterium]